MAKKKGEGEALLSNTCLHIAHAAFLLKEAVNKKEGFQCGRQKEKEKASDAMADFYPLFVCHWGSEKEKEALIKEAFDAAHKEGFGNGKRWKRENAIKEVEVFLSKLRLRLKYLEFRQDAEESKKEKSIPGKLCLSVSPEPVFLSDHEAFILETFLGELETNMKKTAKQLA